MQRDKHENSAYASFILNHLSTHKYECCVAWSKHNY